MYYVYLEYSLTYGYVMSMLSPSRHTLSSTLKNIDVMAIIITYHLFLYFAFQPKCLCQVGADAYPLIPGWDFRGDYQTFFGLKLDKESNGSTPEVWNCLEHP